MARLGVEIVGSAAGLQAALGESLASINEWATGAEGAGVKVTEMFAGVSTSALAAAAAQDKLAIAVGKYGPGTLGAAAATLRYRNEVESLGKSQLAAAASVGRGLTTYVTAPTVLAGYEATKMATSYEDAMRLIQTQAGASGTELQAMQEQVLKLVQSGQSFGQTAVEMANGLYPIESEGIRGAAALKILQAAAQGAAVGQTDLLSTANALTGAMRSYGLGAGEATQTMATLNAIVGSGKLKMDDLNAALGTRFLATAQALGIPLEQAGAALDTFTKANIPAQTAANQLTTSFVKFEAPTKAATKALAQLGLTHTQLAQDLKTGGLTSALGELVRAYETLKSSQGSVVANQAILNSFGGSRSGAGVLELVKQAPSYQQSLGNIQAQANPATFLADVAKTMDLPSQKIKQDVAEIGASMIQLGTAIAPIVASIAGDISGVVDAFDKLPGPVKRNIEFVIGILAVGGPLLSIFVAIKRGITEIGSTFDLLSRSAAPAATQSAAELRQIQAAAATAQTSVQELSASFETLPAAATSATSGVDADFAGLDAVLTDAQLKIEQAATAFAALPAGAGAAVAGVQADLAELGASAATLQAQLAAVGAPLDALPGEAATAAAGVDAELVDIGAAVEVLQTQLVEAGSTLAGLAAGSTAGAAGAAEAAGAAGGVAASEVTLDMQRIQAAALTAQNAVRELATSFATLPTAAGAATGGVDGDLAGLDTMLAGAQLKIAEAAGAFSDLPAAAATAVAGVEGDLAGLGSTIAALQVKLADLGTPLDALPGEAATAAAGVDTQLAEMGVAANALQVKLELLGTTLAALGAGSALGGGLLGAAAKDGGGEAVAGGELAAGIGLRALLGPAAIALGIAQGAQLFAHSRYGHELDKYGNRATDWLGLTSTNKDPTEADIPKIRKDFGEAAAEKIQTWLDEKKAATDVKPPAGPTGVATTANQQVDTTASKPIGDTNRAAYTPGLTPAQQLQLNLEAHPDDATYLREKAAADQSAINFLNSRRDEGKITNEQYLAAIKGIYQDRQSIETTLAGLATKAAAAAKNAAKLETTVPENLQVEQAVAATTPDTGDDVQAAQAIKTWAENLIASRHLSGQALVDALGYVAQANQTLNQVTVPIGLQLEQARAAAANSTAAELKVAGEIKAWAEEQLASGKLTQQGQLAALGIIAQQNQTLGQFQLPPKLSEEEARANALAVLDPQLGGGPSSLQVALAKRVKETAEKAIRSHTLTMQGLTDAWNAIAQANQTLAAAQGAVDTYKGVSSKAFTAGLDLTREQRVTIAERYAQGQGHHGHAPTGPGAQGQVIHLHNPVFQGVTNVRELSEQLGKLDRGKHQRRGGRQ